MSTEVVMPQMGESIAEGTITKWLKKVGDHVERDEPLFEISTDKVDAEIPSPAAGTLTEIRFKEGETVEVNKVVAVLEWRLNLKPRQAEPAATKTEAPDTAARVTSQLRRKLHSQTTKPEPPPSVVAEKPAPPAVPSGISSKTRDNVHAPVAHRS